MGGIDEGRESRGASSNEERGRTTEQERNEVIRRKREEALADLREITEMAKRAIEEELALEEKEEMAAKFSRVAVVVDASPEKDLGVFSAPARALLAGLNERGVPPSSIKPILAHLGDYLTGEKPIAEGQKFTADFFNRLRELEASDKAAASLMRKILIDQKDQLGLNEEYIHNVLSSEGRPLSSIDADGAATAQPPRDDWEKLQRDFESLSQEASSFIANLSIDDERTKGLLSTELNSISGLSLSPEGRRERRTAFVQMVHDLEGRGLIDRSTAEKLENYAEKYLSLLKKGDSLFLSRPDRGGSLIRTAKDLGMAIDDRFRKNLSYFDNINNFINRFILDESGRVRDSIDFEEINDKIIEVADAIIRSAVNYATNKDFDSSFSTFYTKGRFYQIFQERVQNLASELERLERTNPQFASLGERKVIIKTATIIPEASAKSEGKRLAVPSERRVNLKEAVGVYGVRSVARLLEVSRALHNIEYIVDNGLGWKKLAEYTDTLGEDGIDWLFRRDPELVRAYQYYIVNLREAMVLNNRIIPGEFGLKGASTLDQQQEQTLIQLLAAHAVDGETGNVPIHLVERLSRTVRLASAIAKGGTGEFWGVFMDAQMPMAFEEKDGRKEIGQAYKGVFHSGVEKMLAEMNLDVLMVRFNLPHPFGQLLRYVFMKRELDDYEGWDHREVYKVKELYEHALVHGASEDFLAFLHEHVILADTLRSPLMAAVDAIARGSWRLEEYKVFFRYLQEREGGEKKLDFGRTLAGIMAVGSKPLETFIKNVSQYVDIIDPQTIPTTILRQKEVVGLIKKINGLGKNEGEKKKRLIENLQQILYEDLLFESMLQATPTRVVSLERRLYTPEDQQLVIERLHDFLENEFRGKIDPSLINSTVVKLFLNAVHYVEKQVLDENRQRAWEIINKSGGFSPADRDEAVRLLMHRFSLADLQKDRYRAGLLQFLNEFKKRQASFSYGDYRFDPEIISEDNFFKILPEFLKEIRGGMEIERRRGKGERYGKSNSDQITLNERFYHWMIDLSLFNYEIGADDLDWQRFLMQQGGARVYSRAFGEVALEAEKIVGNIKKLLFNEIPDFIATDFDSKEAMMKHTKEKFGPIFKEIIESLKMYAGPDSAHEVAVRLVSYLRRIIGKDSAYDHMAFGTIEAIFSKTWDLKEPSLGQDFLPSTIKRPTNSLTMGQMEELGRYLLNMAGVPLKKMMTVGYDEKGRKKTKKVKVSIEDWEKGGGYTIKRKIWNRILPITVIVALIILFQLMWQGKKKNKE